MKPTIKVQEAFLTPNPYSRPQIQLKKVAAIAWHYVGNPNTSAINNRNYFENLKTTHAAYASSHFIIGLQGEILHLIPLNEAAYTTNEANSYSIGIECCHQDASGRFNRATYDSMVELGAYLNKMFKLEPLTGNIRHYDVTKKICPKWFVDHPADWDKFKQDIKNKMEGDEIDMEELKKLQQMAGEIQKAVEEINRQTADIDKRVKKLENPMIYNLADDSLPGWAGPTVQKLINKGYLLGGENGLDLDDNMLRLLVISDRAGVYDT